MKKIFIFFLMLCLVISFVSAIEFNKPELKYQYQNEVPYLNDHIDVRLNAAYSNDDLKFYIDSVEKDFGCGSAGAVTACSIRNLGSGGNILKVLQISTQQTYSADISGLNWASATYCIDSDTGLDYNTKGTVTLPTTSWSDACSSYTLFEYYCVGNEKKLKEYNCPNGCFEGRCLEGKLKERLKIESAEITSNGELKVTLNRNLDKNKVDAGINCETFEKIKLVEVSGNNLFFQISSLSKSCLKSNIREVLVKDLRTDQQNVYELKNLVWDDLVFVECGDKKCDRFELSENCKIDCNNLINLDIKNGDEKGIVFDFTYHGSSCNYKVTSPNREIYDSKRLDNNKEKNNVFNPFRYDYKTTLPISGMFSNPVSGNYELKILCMIPEGVVSDSDNVFINLNDEELTPVKEAPVESYKNCKKEACEVKSEYCKGSDIIKVLECKSSVWIENNCEDMTHTKTEIKEGACISEVKKSCESGCLYGDGTCIPIGIRVRISEHSFYCDLTKALINQKKDSEKCQNDYECNSNNCKNGICTTICEGCIRNGQCIPYGTRLETTFCGLSKTFDNQKQEEIPCNNNYECTSNICVNNQCVSPSFIQKIIDWFKKLFG